MTLSCDNCGSTNLELVDDNSAVHGSQVRSEKYECQNCGDVKTKVLIPSSFR